MTLAVMQSGVKSHTHCSNPEAPETQQYNTWLPVSDESNITTPQNKPVDPHKKPATPAPKSTPISQSLTYQQVVIEALTAN
nr:hypothetical protein B0A51_14027 [Rachicladosporium sp. CCFEE 5018]